MYWKILPPKDIEDAEEKKEIHNYAIKDCEVQVQIVDTEISIKFDPLAIEESNLSAKKEEEYLQCLDRKIKLLRKKRFHLTAEGVYRYYIQKVIKASGRTSVQAFI